jgi:SAM-dependent methyltransferase
VQKLSVLMPVFNEARTLRTIIDRVLSSPIDLDIELICVDDGSTDESLEILRDLAGSDPRIFVVAQPFNQGKGKAIRTAIEHITGDLAIIQDADLEYDPAEYPKVLAPILAGDADAVYGSRLAYSEVRRVLFFWHSLGNKILTLLSNMANDLNLTDMETCYKAFRADVLKNLRLTSDRFGIEPEITSRLGRAQARIYEVPISYHGRTYAEGKNIGWRDGLQALWLIFKFRFIDTTSSIDSGHATLESLAAAPAVATWMLEQFEPHLGDIVLEAGSGLGNLTGHLIDKKSLVAVDIDTLHLARIRKRFGHLENLEVVHGDLEDPALFESLPDTFDSVLCVNVLEHLDRPEIAVQGFHETLRLGGKALILVPANQSLYSEADRALGHRKRYDARGLHDLVTEAGFEVSELYSFNRLGVLGWWVNKLTRRTDIARWQASLFAVLVPFARLIERLRWLPGLSLVVVGVKT